MNGVLEPFHEPLEVLEALLESPQIFSLQVAPARVRQFADALSQLHRVHRSGVRYARVGGAGRGGNRARSSAVIWRTTSDPARICSRTAASFSRRRSSARSCAVFIP